MDGTYYNIKDSSVKDGSNEWKTYKTQRVERF